MGALGEALFDMDLGPAEGGAGAGGDADFDSRMTCCICLGDIPLEDFASVKGCEHMYCVGCILQWAVHVEERRAAKPSVASGPYAAAARGAGGGSVGAQGVPCPTCRLPFEELLTYRALDGSLRDYLLPESIRLLSRAPWCRAVRARHEAGKTPAVSSVDFDAEPEVEDYHLEDEEDYFDEADYYGCNDKYAYQVRQSGAGKARVVVGNRRWGNGGYVSSGRMMARPRNNSSGAGSSSGIGSKGQGTRGKAGRVGKGKGAPLGGHVDSQLSLSCSPPGLGSTPPLGSSPPSCHLGLGDHVAVLGKGSPEGGGDDAGTPRQGRRAKRAAKRAAQQVSGAA